MQESVIVLGGAGFVGSNLCKYLAENTQYQVLSIDNYFTGSADNHINGVKYINGDAGEISSLVTSTPKFVFHLAEYSRVEASFEDFELVWRLGAKQISNVLLFCRDHKCKLIYAGSSTKFGHGDFDHNSSPYAFLKAQHTELVKNFADWFKLDYAITYFYNVYGPREIKSGKYATVVARFLELSANKLPLTVVQPGTQKRNFTHVDDIVSALHLIAESGTGDGYGIGSDEAYSILELTKLFNAPIKMLPERAGNRFSADVVIDKTKSLGWVPTKTISEYIFENS